MQHEQVFITVLRDNVTFKRDLKTFEQALLGKKLSCKVSLYTANPVYGVGVKKYLQLAY